MCRARIEDTDFKPDEAMLTAMQAKIVTCSNDGCAAQISAALWQHHQSECPEALVGCTHAEFGCPFEGRRATLQSHSQNCMYEGLKYFIGRTRDEFAHLHGLTHQLEGIVGEQGQLIDALWPVSPLDPWNHIRFVHLIFWRWNQIPNEQARWLQSSFSSFVCPIFTILPFFLFVLSAMLSPAPLPAVSFTDIRAISDQGADIFIPKWVILMSLEAMCVGFLLELLVGTFQYWQDSWLATLALGIVRALVVCGSALIVSVMSPIAAFALCLALNLPGSLALLGAAEMDMSRRGVPIGVLVGFVLTESSGVLLGTLVVSFKVLAIVILSLFPFSNHDRVEHLLVVGDQATGGPFDVELRLQLNYFTSSLVASGPAFRKVVVVATGALIPVILYIGFPYLLISYGLFVLFHSILYMLPPFVITSLRDSAQVGGTSVVCRCVYVLGLFSLMGLGLPGMLRLPMAMDKLADHLDELPQLLGLNMRVDLGPDL